MICPIESLGEFMLFRCRVCKTIFDCVANVSKGNQLTAELEGIGPVDRNFISIHLKCPRCSEVKVYYLWLLEK